MPAWAVDALLSVAVALTMAAVITANYGGRQDPDALAYLWAAGLGALMLVRRRHPVLVLAVTVLGLFAYYAAGYPVVGIAVPVAAALYSAAELGRMGSAMGAAVVALVVSVAFRLAEGQELAIVAGYELAGHVLLMAGAIALGDGVRSRRSLVASNREVLALTAERAHREAEVAAQAQRVAVARELHDSIGHSTSVISLHADVAREAVHRHDAGAATDALHVIKDTAAQTMGELRRTVSLLRTPGRAAPRPPGLAEVREITDLGPGVELTTDIRVPDTLSSAVDVAAFRIVQESVTNIVKHSSARRVSITAETDDDELVLSVVDDGGSPSGHADATGHGIAGMRERAAALGGTLTAGPAEGGFAVRARIPLGVQP